MSSIPGLPIVSDAQLPAAVRSGSQDDKDSYKSAMGFEQIFLDDAFDIGDIVHAKQPQFAGR